MQKSWKSWRTKKDSTNLWSMIMVDRAIQLSLHLKSTGTLGHTGTSSHTGTAGGALVRSVGSYSGGICSAESSGNFETIFCTGIDLLNTSRESLTVGENTDSMAMCNCLRIGTSRAALLSGLNTRTTSFVGTSSFRGTSRRLRWRW